MKFNHVFAMKSSDSAAFHYECGNISARLDFISGNVIRAAIFNKGEYILPTFNVNPQNKRLPDGRDRLSTEDFSGYSPKVTRGENEDSFELENGLKLTVKHSNFTVSIESGEGVLYSDRPPLAYNFENEFGDGVYHYLLRGAGERIYGLGDKGGSLDKSGRTFRIETSDSMGYDAESSDPLYKAVPFYLCRNEIGCYGLFYDTSDTSYFDFGREINNYYQPFKYFKSRDNALVYYIFLGSALDIIQSFSRLTGAAAFPPKWSFDYCASTMAYTDAPNSNEQMNAFIDKLKEEDLSCSGFYLSSGYTSIGAGRYVFNWNYDKFPDPAAFVKHFRDNGIELIPNIKPAFLQDHPMYDEIAEKGLFVKNPDGTPFVTQFWDGLGSYLDFTNEEAYDFWSSQVTDKLLSIGIKSTWNDNNEFDIRDTDAVASGFGSEIKASRLRPSLTYLMVRSSYDAQVKTYPGIRPFLSTRSGGIGVKRMAQTWSGDNTTSFHDLKFCHKIGLTMSLSGFYFYGHDLGGFHGEMPERELLLRWMQHGVFEPRFTIHSWNSDGSATMPWSYEDIMPAVRDIFSVRKKLRPYLYNCAYRAVMYHEPINSPAMLYYDDPEADPEADAMLVGRDIFVPFILDKSAEETDVHLPAGDDWYLGDKFCRGGGNVQLTIPADAAPVWFVRAGSVIPTDEAKYGFGTDTQLEFTVYPIENGEYSSEYFDDDGESFAYLNNDCVKLEFTVRCTAETVEVKYRNKGNVKFNPSLKLVSSDKRKLTVTEEN